MLIIRPILLAITVIKNIIITKIHLIFILVASTINSFGQIALINDPDGYTNIRLEKTANSEIIHQFKDDEVFFVDIEYIDLKSKWIKVVIPHDRLSKYYTSGFIHHSRIQSLDSLPILKSNNLKLVFDLQKADSTKVLQKIPYGLEIPLSMSYEIKEMKIIWKGQTFSQDKKWFDDLYNIDFNSGIYTSDQKRFAIYKKEETYFIKQSCADGGGYYEVVWVIKNGIIIQRLAGWIT